MKISIDGESFEYDANKLLNTEAIALQKVTGMRPPAFGEALQEGDAIAITGLVWLMWRRIGKVMAFEDVEFDLAALELEDDDADPKADASKG